MLANKELPKIATRTEAEAHLSQIAHLTGLLQCAVAARDQAILDVQARHAPLLQELAKDIELRRIRLELWALENREQEFGEAKTLKFPDGKIFFRQGQRKLTLLPDWTWESTLEKLLTFDPVSQWSEYIRREPEIDKAKLLKDTGGHIRSRPVR